MKIYRFLTDDDSSQFCHKVTEALSKGWELHCDPTYAHYATVGVMRLGLPVVKEIEAAYSPSLNLVAQ